MNPLAEELNQMIAEGNQSVLSMLSKVGRQLFFPKGILSQSAEAKEKAHRINATIGIAKEAGHTMRLDSIMRGVKGIRASQSLTYAPSFGIPGLRKRWQEELYAKNPSLAGKRISLPVVTCGITHAISIFADVWVDPGDVILLPDMFWGNYNMIFNVRKGARLSNYPLFDTQGGFNSEALAAAIEKESRANSKIVVLLNFPHNPTGYTVSEKEADDIVRVLTQAAEKDFRSLRYWMMPISDFFTNVKLARNPFLPNCAAVIPTCWQSSWTVPPKSISFGACGSVLSLTAPRPMAMLCRCTKRWRKKQPAASGVISPMGSIWGKPFCCSPCWTPATKSKPERNSKSSRRAP